MGLLPPAREQLEAGLETAKESGVARTVAQLHEAVGRLEREVGERERARRHQERAITGFERLGDTDRAHEIRSRLVA